MAARVGVVGAGLAGLTAAVELRARGFDVDVFERSRLVGGKATSFELDGAEVDNGQHVYLGCFSEWLDLVHTLGLERELRLQPRFQVLLLRRGEPPARLGAADLPSPLHLAPVLLRYPALGWLDRARLARALLGARAAPPADVTFGDWLRDRGQGDRLRQRFWEPFLVPALNADLDEVSADAGTFVVRTAFLGDPGACRIGLLRVPLARVAEAAAARATNVHLRAPVASILVEQGAAVGVELVDGRRAALDGVVLAVPPPVAGRLLGDPARFAGFLPRAIVDVHLWYDRPSLGFDFAALLDSPVQWVFEKGAGYVCCSLSSAGPLINQPRDELVAMCHAELAAVLPAVAGARLLRGAVTRDPEATFLPGPRLARPGPATEIPNLTLAGAWTATGWPATMESAVRSGRAAARLLAAREVAHAA